MNYRMNQRVCKVDWREGQPCLRLGKVTKVTTRTYRVDNQDRRSFGWAPSWQGAIQLEYAYLLKEWGMYSLGIWKKQDDWTINDSIRCICRLRRLERRLRKRRSPTK